MMGETTAERPAGRVASSPLLEVNDGNFRVEVMVSPDPWIILFGAEWSPESVERLVWLKERRDRLPADVRVAYAEIRVASLPAHYCGVICVPTLVLWRNKRVVGYLHEFFLREQMDSAFSEWARILRR